MWLGCNLALQLCGWGVWRATIDEQLSNSNLQTEFVRGEGMGGGVGGMVYSIKNGHMQGEHIICSHANHRGDVIARSNQDRSLTSFALYEAYGTRPYEWGDDPDRQNANTKEEESDLGLLNEGMRFRDLETGVFLTRDPIGDVDGPNVYCYVHCNPITKFDARGLNTNTIEFFDTSSGESSTYSTVDNISYVQLEISMSDVAVGTADAAAPHPIQDSTLAGQLWTEGGIGSKILAVGLVAGVVSDIGDIVSPGIDAIDGLQKVGRDVAEATLGKSARETAEETFDALQDGMKMGTDDALDTAGDILGEGYSEVGEAGSGVFRSADGDYQVRMTNSDIESPNGHADGAHMNFEKGSTTTKPNGKETFDADQNKHIMLPEEDVVTQTAEEVAK